MRSPVHCYRQSTGVRWQLARNKIEQCYKRSDLGLCLRSEKGPKLNHCRVGRGALIT